MSQLVEPMLACRGIDKAYGRAQALDGFDLSLERGKLLALLGPSGCGKTTALRIIAGFEKADAGRVVLGGRVVADSRDWVPPERRRIGMVFQEWALFPHLDVWHNIAFGVEGQDRDAIGQALAMMRLTGLETRMPHELSGGQQQRVALARALAPSPDVILLDEPFSNLDAGLRARVRGEVREILHEAKATAIFVTHDQEEALSMADELAVMSDGKILQTGTPHDLYRGPETREVAALVGESNFLAGVVRGGVAETCAGRLQADGVPEGSYTVMVRPEAIVLTPADDGSARVLRTEFYGHDQLITAAFADGTELDVRLLGPHPELVVDCVVSVLVTEQPRFYPRSS